MHTEAQPSSSDIIEWTARPFDQEDVEIGRGFRQGTLDCRDILAVDKYQQEGIIGALVLPNSLVQYGIGWFRTVPIGFEGQFVANPDAQGDPLKPKEKDDFSLKLLASIFLAANSNQEFCRAGGLFDLLQCDLKAPKNSGFKLAESAPSQSPVTQGKTNPKRAASPTQQKEKSAKKHQTSASPERTKVPSSDSQKQDDPTVEVSSKAFSKNTGEQKKRPEHNPILPAGSQEENYTPSIETGASPAIQSSTPAPDQGTSSFQSANIFTRLKVRHLVFTAPSGLAYSV